MADDRACRYARDLCASLRLDPIVVTAPATSTRAVTAMGVALSLLQHLAPEVDLDCPDLLSERARYYGFDEPTSVSSGGATRLIRCVDGHVALALARSDDFALLPALVEGAVADPWGSVGTWAVTRPVLEVRDRAVLLGLACSIPGETVSRIPWVITERPFAAGRSPRVLDLSSLWAGPLCSWLLGRLGCEIVKVEDPGRPDGARENPAWFSRLYPAALTAELADLGGLLPDADVVIESSRPRALQQRGFRPESFPGVWVSITGYGRDQPGRIGYGDDAAVAGGLVGPGPTFVGDAAADPLTGVHAALATWALLSTGRGGLIDIALARSAAAAAAL